MVVLVVVGVMVGVGVMVEEDAVEVEVVRRGWEARRMSRATLSRGLLLSWRSLVSGRGGWTAVPLVSAGAGTGPLGVNCDGFCSTSESSRLRRSGSESEVGLGWVESERELHFEVCVLLEASEDRAEVPGGTNRSAVI